MLPDQTAGFFVRFFPAGHETITSKGSVGLKEVQKLIICLNLMEVTDECTQDSNRESSGEFVVF